VLRSLKRRTALAFSATVMSGGVSARLSTTHQFLTCGGDILRLRDANADEPLWTWSAKSDSNIPMPLAEAFKTIADCKAIDNGGAVLIASSHDGVAIVDRGPGTASFYAIVGHAHSADISDDGHILVAGSDGPRGGDVLALFHRSKSGRRIAERELDSAHGVVFDPKLDSYWVLGRSKLQLISNTPALTVFWGTQLPSNGGHDLISVNDNELILTTDSNVFLFSRTERKFRLHPTLGDQSYVKSVSVAASGATVYIKADNSPDGVWWTHTARFFDGSTILVPEKIYKIRFLDAFKL
jgi:Family of unknown function (DUF6528)